MSNKSSDQHRIGYTNGVSGKPEYGTFEAYKTGQQGQDRRDGFNAGKEDRARINAEADARKQK